MSRRVVGWLGLLGCLTWLGACSDGVVAVMPPDDDDSEADDDAADDDDVADDDVADDDVDPMWDEAELLVHSPTSGDFIPLGDPVVLEAEVVDGDGEPTGWDEVFWTTDQDEDFEYEGAFGEIEEFPVGEHVITAKTELPNGDRLSYAVGGVLIQHEYAGVYAGTVNISVDLEFQGYPISAQCVGAVDFEVDAYGELLEGTGSCVASIAGYFDFDVSLLIDGEIDGSVITGSISIDMGWLGELPTDYTGEFIASDEMTGSFEDDYYGTTVTGDVEAHRVALSS